MKTKLFHSIFNLDPKTLQIGAKKGISIDQATRTKYLKPASKKDFWEWLDWDVETQSRKESF